MTQDPTDPEEKQPRNSGARKSRGRLVIKIEPGQKLLWRLVDGQWSRYLVDAAAQA